MRTFFGHALGTSNPRPRSSCLVVHGGRCLGGKFLRDGSRAGQSSASGSICDQPDALGTDLLPEGKFGHFLLPTRLGMSSVEPGGQPQIDEASGRSRSGWHRPDRNGAALSRRLQRRSVHGGDKRLSAVAISGETGNRALALIGIYGFRTCSGKIARSFPAVKLSPLP